MTLAELHANEREDLSLLTIAEAASYLSISRGAVYNLLNSGALASIHIGRARRIAMCELRRFVAAVIASQR